MSEVTIREAREADAAFVLHMLELLAVEVGEADELDTGIEDVRRDAFGPQRRYVTLIAELDGRPAGLATYFFTYSTYKGARCLYVNDLVVEAWARGENDIGRRLMAHMARIAEENECCRLDLRVHTHNEARGFYERLGMAQSDDLPYILRGGELTALAERYREG